MNKREVKRRARFAAAQLIENGIDNGVALLLTDDGSDEQIVEATAALRAVAHSLVRTLPSDYEPPIYQQQWDDEDA